ncbi:hypothetical protein Fmac_033021 [Flemingia macrophylla]|uniref:Uncharacterized protein n=1 Tax=Flemingia macrophylla TaxID=520843 RepID=A0ABD1L811_9FABA
MEQCRQGKSAKWIRNLGKRIGYEGWARGTQSRTPRLSVDCSSYLRGESGSSRAGRGMDWEWALRGLFPGSRTSTDEGVDPSVQVPSDCFLCGCLVFWRKNPSSLSRLSIVSSPLQALDETTAKGTGLAESAGKEDLVEFDSSPTL